LPPLPITKTETLETPVGAIHVNVPEPVKTCCPVATVVVMLLLAALAALWPAEFVALTVNV
jgi:hypothetical protein